MNVRKLISIPVLIALIPIISACGGSGGGSTSPSAPTLSESVVLPDQSLGISHRSIEEGDSVKLDFRSPDDSAVIQTVYAIASADGEVVIPVPTYIDSSTGEISSGVMNLHLNDDELSVALTIDEVLELSFRTDGIILLALLEATRDKYLTTLTQLNNIALNTSQVTTSESVASVNAALDKINDWIADFNSTGSITFDDSDPDSRLGPEELNILDLRLLLSMLSADIFADGLLADTDRKAHILDLQQNSQLEYRQPPVTQLIRDSWDDFQRALGNSPASSEVKQSATDLFEQTLDKGKDAASKAVTGLTGYISLMTAGASRLGGSALSGVAKAGSQGNALFSSLSGYYTAWLTNENTDSFDTRDKIDFDASQELLSQVVRYGSNTLGNFLPGDQGGDFFGDFNTTVTVSDVLEAAEVEVCNFEISFFCGTTVTRVLEVVSYLNFDGSTGLDGTAADIQLSGDPSFPQISWSGQGISLTVSQFTTTSVIPNIFGVTGTNGQGSTSIQPFGSFVRYGDYTGNVNIVGEDPSPALTEGSNYAISLQNSSFQSATLVFTVR